MPVGPLSAPFHKADTPCALQNFRQHASDTNLRTGHPHLSSVLKTGPKDTRGRNTRGDRSRRGHVFTGHPALPPPQPRLPSEAVMLALTVLVLHTSSTSGNMSLRGSDTSAQLI